jgi:hypothetical protein
MSEIPGQSGHVLPTLQLPVCAKTRHDGSVLVDARIPEAIANAAANARAPNAAVTLEAKRYLRGRSGSRTTSFARLSDRSPR